MKYKIAYKFFVGSLFMCIMSIGLLAPLIYLYSKQYSDITIRTSNEVSKIVIDQASTAYINMAKEAARTVSLNVVKSLDEYIAKNPKNLRDYIDDKLFREIALRRMFDRGYTVITEPETYLDVAIDIPEFNGQYIYNFPGYKPEIYREILGLIDKSVTTDGVSGDYGFYEPNGTYEEKFVYISKVHTKTKDNKNLVVLAIGYKSDFVKKTHELNRLLENKFIESSVEVEAKGHQFIFASIITIIFVFLLSILFSLYFFKKIMRD